MEPKFLLCKHCGNIVTFVKFSGVPVVCCGENMTEIVPGASDGAAEKHVPVIEAEGNKVIVTVGAADHPMLPEHYIEFIILQTEKSVQRKSLTPGSAPRAEFFLGEGDRALRAYAWCNKHGLWKT